MTKKHSVCSASSSHRWLHCPGSISAIEEARKLGLVEIKSSIYAEEGTKCHTLAESLLNQYLNFPTPDIDPWDFTDEMREAAKFYVNKVIEEIAAFDTSPHVKVEVVLELDQDLGMFGTSDCAITGYINGVATGIILDLKYGKTKVVAENNPQLAFYACAMRKTSKKKLQNVKVVIVQPRIKNPITEVSYSFDELIAWEDKLKIGADKAITQYIFKSLREYLPGSHCKWCDGLVVCPAKNKKPDASEGLEFLVEGE